MNRTALLIASLVFAEVWALSSAALCNETPFVAAFDRFAPHNDIELAVGGRLLLSELSCTACHATKVARLQPKKGPRLEGAGQRLQGDWVRQFLHSPQKTKPGTTMPDVLAGLGEEEKQPAIAALAAFLASQHEPYPVVKANGLVPVPFEFWDVGDLEQGKQLYHQVGCVACHEPANDYETAEAAPTPIDTLLEQLDPEEIEEMGLGSAVRPVKSVPHGDLPAKYSLKSLTFFLLDPASIRPSGRMPGLRLGPMEAAHIAAYLLRDQQRVEEEKPKTVDQSLREEGKRLFSELGCASCHTAGGIEAGGGARPLAKLKIDDQQSCFAATTKGRPHYSLDEIQTKAILAAMAELPAGKTRDDHFQVKFWMMQLNCFGCHEREGLGGVGRNRKAYFETVRHVDLGDEGRIPPPLTGVGQKLTADSLKKVLNGSDQVRPHLLARMPRFSATSVWQLPEAFAKVDRAEAPPEQKVPPPPNGFVAAGQRLLDTGCVECHPMRGESLPGVVGIDLETVTSRVEFGWFHDFLLNPAELKSRTRMPTFFPNGVSQQPDILDGSTDQQIAAIWHYLREIKKHPLPEKIVKARSQDFELVPTEQPILLRTFMHEAGTHALAVGFAEKVHFAFDTENPRLAVAWRGRFLDAQGTWFVRSTPPAVPLGKELIELPKGPALAVLAEKKQAWPSFDAEQDYRFEGYRLDPEGVPTMLYRVGDYQVQDRTTPNNDGGLTRRLTIVAPEKKDATGKLWLRANVGKSLQQVNENSTINEKHLTVSVAGGVNSVGQLRTIEGSTESLFEVEVDNETTIEVQYQW
ncbi:MAG: cytochrome c [Planctomycetes bacterium]|nr:cytochrome c [Planctomycetota bacterium]